MYVSTMLKVVEIKRKTLCKKVSKLLTGRLYASYTMHLSFCLYHCIRNNIEKSKNTQGEKLNWTGLDRANDAATLHINLQLFATPLIT